MAKSITYRDQIEQLRADIAKLREQAEWLKNAPLCIAEAKARADVYVNGLAAVGISDRIGCFFSNDSTASDLMSLQKNVFSIGDGEGPVCGMVTIDIAPIIGSLLPDLLRARLHDLIDEHADLMDCGPPAEERRAELADVERKLFDAEHQEEKLIVEAESEGIDIARRRDADPAAVLGIFEE